MKVIVIMAGGAGERFWPLSRHTQPKQLLKLTGSGQSLLEEAVERSMAIVPPANIYIATGQHLKQAIIDADLGIPAENIIAEPCKRNAAGCLIYAAATILARANLSPEELTLGVLTAALVLGEPLCATILLGVLLTLLGVALCAHRQHA